LFDIIGILAWGVGFISQSAWACLEKDDNLVEAIQANKSAYAKTLKVAWGV
jgi:predicted RNA methylase